MPDSNETKILWIESLIPRLKQKTAAIRSLADQLDQEIAQLLYRDNTAGGSPPANITFSIHVNGCIAGSIGGVGATVEIRRAGTLLYSGTTDSSSNITAASFYDSLPGSTYNWTVIPATVRQSTATFNRVLNAGTNATFNQALSANTPSYACMVALNSIPLKANIQCVDSNPVGGTMTLPFVAVASKWFKVTGAHNYALGTGGAFFLDGSTLNLSIASATWTDTGALNVVYVLGANRAGHLIGDTFTLFE